MYLLVPSGGKLVKSKVLSAILQFCWSLCPVLLVPAGRQCARGAELL